MNKMDPFLRILPLYFKRENDWMQNLDLDQMWTVNRALQRGYKTGDGTRRATKSRYTFNDIIDPLWKKV